MIKTRKNFGLTYVWSVLLYGSEAWTLTVQDEQKNRSNGNVEKWNRAQK